MNQAVRITDRLIKFIYFYIFIRGLQYRFHQPFR